MDTLHVSQCRTGSYLRSLQPVTPRIHGGVTLGHAWCWRKEKETLSWVLALALLTICFVSLSKTFVLSQGLYETIMKSSLGRPTSWKTWSHSWGNIEEWPPLSRSQLLSRAVGRGGLRSWREGRNGDQGVEQPGQRLSTDPSGLLLKRSPEL